MRYPCLVTNFEALGRALDEARTAAEAATTEPGELFADLGLEPAPAGEIWGPALRAAATLVRAAERERELLVRRAVDHGMAIKPAAKAAGVAHTTALRWRDQASK